MLCGGGLFFSSLALCSLAPMLHNNDIFCRYFWVELMSVALPGFVLTESLSLRLGMLEMAGMGSGHGLWRGGGLFAGEFAI